MWGTLAAAGMAEAAASAARAKSILVIRSPVEMVEPKASPRVEAGTNMSDRAPESGIADPFDNDGGKEETWDLNAAN